MHSVAKKYKTVISRLNIMVVGLINYWYKTEMSNNDYKTVF